MMNTSEISIPSILKIESGALNKIGGYLKAEGISRVVVFFGNGLIDLFGNRVLESFRNAGVEVGQYCELDTTRIEDIIEIAFSIHAKRQAVVGIGGGKVIDVAKYVSYLRKMHFISVPTSTSSDGFSSSSASLIVNNRRNSVPAHMAYGIIVDLDVLKSAPDKFIYSGIGDLVSKITAVYDWGYEGKTSNAVVDDFAVMIAKKAVNSFVRTPFKDIHDDLFLRELVDSLAMSGIANEIAGGSSPTSGSEHMISHALDKILEIPQLHGIQVGVATYVMALVHNHRYERINKVFVDTGFWDYVETLNLNVEDYEKAIDLAPSIKPNRHVYLHEEEHRKHAKMVLRTDEMLKRVFHL